VFETAPNHFLQSLASGPLTAFMSAITLTGYFPFYLLVLAVIIFGVDLRRGVLLSQLVLWTLAFTDLLKAGVAMPRPVDVDSTLRRLDTGAPNTAAFAGAGGRSFLGLPTEQAIEYYRGLSGYSFGFPSGHVSSATTFWGGAALLFRRRWMVPVALAMIVLMAISRMYLGRHFLADVLGGGLLGVIVLAGGLSLFAARWAPVPLLGDAELRLGILALVGLVGAPLLLFFLPGAELNAGRLLGLNLGYLLLAAGGRLPSDQGSMGRRALRILLAVALAAASLRLMPGATALSGWEWGGGLGELLAGAIPPFVMLTGTVLLGRRLGLYSPRPIKA
jgi:membrane-associated phospholipid phosphatase